MLERLDAIDWTALTHAYGPATDLPALIRGLAAESLEEMDVALSDLFGNIWHQGTVYPASAAALPFLYELLDAPGVPDPSRVAFLIASIADGSVYLTRRVSDDKERAMWERILAKQGKTLEGQLAEEAATMAAVRAGVSAGLPRLVRFLNDPEPAVRREVAIALGHHPEHASWLLPAIADALAVEDDPDVRKALGSSQKQLNQNSST